MPTPARLRTGQRNVADVVAMSEYLRDVSIDPDDDCEQRTNDREAWLRVDDDENHGRQSDGAGIGLRHSPRTGDGARVTIAAPRRAQTPLDPGPFREPELNRPATGQARGSLGRPTRCELSIGCPSGPDRGS